MAGLSMAKSTPITPEELSQFDEQGFVVVEDLLDVETDFGPVVAEYDTVLEQLVDRWEADGHLSNRHQTLPFTQRLLATVTEARRPYDQAMDISLPQAGIHSDTPMHLGPAVFRLLNTPTLLDAGEQFIGPEIYSNPVQHTRIKLPESQLPSEARTGLTARIDWHQDQGVITNDADECDILTVWFPVTEADLENGCLAVVPGSHKRDLVTHCKSTDPLTLGQVSIPEPLVEPHQSPLPMNPGDVLFMHRRTQHSGLPNRSDRVRWSFDLRYQPIGQPTGREWFPGFVARSQAHPESVQDDHQAWAASWQAARQRLASGDDVRFNRWTGDSHYCA